MEWINDNSLDDEYKELNRFFTSFQRFTFSFPQFYQMLTNYIQQNNIFISYRCFNCGFLPLNHKCIAINMNCLMKLTGKSNSHLCNFFQKGGYKNCKDSNLISTIRDTFCNFPGFNLRNWQIKCISENYMDSISFLENVKKNLGTEFVPNVDFYYLFNKFNVKEPGITEFIMSLTKSYNFEPSERSIRRLNCELKNHFLNIFCQVVPELQSTEITDLIDKCNFTNSLNKYYLLKPIESGDKFADMFSKKIKELHFEISKAKATTHDQTTSNESNDRNPSDQQTASNESNDGFPSDQQTTSNESNNKFPYDHQTTSNESNNESPSDQQVTSNECSPQEHEIPIENEFFLFEEEDFYLQSNDPNYNYNEEQYFD